MIKHAVSKGTAVEESCDDFFLDLKSQLENNMKALEANKAWRPFSLSRQWEHHEQACKDLIRSRQRYYAEAAPRLLSSACSPPPALLLSSACSPPPALLLSSACSPPPALPRLLSSACSPPPALLRLLSSDCSPPPALPRLLSSACSPPRALLRLLSFACSPPPALLRLLSSVSRGELILQRVKRQTKSFIKIQRMVNYEDNQVLFGIRDVRWRTDPVNLVGNDPPFSAHLCDAWSIEHPESYLSKEGSPSRARKDICVFANMVRQRIGEGWQSQDGRHVDIAVDSYLHAIACKELMIDPVLGSECLLDQDARETLLLHGCPAGAPPNLALLRLLSSACSPLRLLSSACSPLRLLSSACSPPPALLSACSPPPALPSACSPPPALPRLLTTACSPPPAPACSPLPALLRLLSSACFLQQQLRS